MASARRLLVQTGALRLAIDVAQVREIAAMPELTSLPNAPAAALGLAMLRGELTPVIDLARLVDPAAAPSTPTRIVALVSPAAALAVERVDALETARDDAGCILHFDGQARPYDLTRALVQCFEDAWRQTWAAAS